VFIFRKASDEENPNKYQIEWTEEDFPNQYPIENFEDESYEDPDEINIEYTGDKPVTLEYPINKKFIQDFRKHHKDMLLGGSYALSEPFNNLRGESFIIMPDGSLDGFEEYHGVHMNSVFKKMQYHEEDPDIARKNKHNYEVKLPDDTYEKIHHIFSGGIRLFLPGHYSGYLTCYQLPNTQQLKAIEKIFKEFKIQILWVELSYEMDGLIRTESGEFKSYDEFYNFIKKFQQEKPPTPEEQERINKMRFFRDPFEEQKEMMRPTQSIQGNLSQEQINSLKKIPLKGTPPSMRWPGASSFDNLIKLASKFDSEKNTKILFKIIQMIKK
jgi:hypothetical protein